MPRCRRPCSSAATNIHEVTDEAWGNSPEESGSANQLQLAKEQVKQSHEHEHVQVQAAELAMMFPGEKNVSRVLKAAASS